MDKYHVMWTNCELIWTVDVLAESEGEAMEKAQIIADEKFKNTHGWKHEWTRGEAYKLCSEKSVHGPILERWCEGQAYYFGGYSYL